MKNKIKINRIHGRMNASKARGSVIVIDVLRAATFEAYCLANNAKYILPVAEVNDALNIKKKNPSFLLAGEKDGMKVDGFDFGNSPQEVLNVDLTGKIIIHRSSSGTRALNQVENAKELIFGSFVTASSIVKYLKKSNSNEISIVGLQSDDDVVGDYIVDLLEEKEETYDVIKNRFLNLPEISRYLDPSNLLFPKSDLHLALEINKFNFFPLVEKADENLIARKFTVEV